MGMQDGGPPSAVPGDHTVFSSLRCLLQPCRGDPPQIMQACCSNAAPSHRLPSPSACFPQPSTEHQKPDRQKWEMGRNGHIGITLNRCLYFVLAHSVAHKHPPRNWKQPG